MCLPAWQESTDHYKMRRIESEKDRCQWLSIRLFLKPLRIQLLLCKAPLEHDKSQAFEALQGMTQHAEHAPQCSTSDVLRDCQSATRYSLQ